MLDTDVYVFKEIISISWVFFQKSIFDKIQKEGIHVNPDDMFYDYFICFDLESILTKVEISNSEKLRWTQKHDPISVSVSSNVPWYTK